MDIQYTFSGNCLSKTKIRKNKPNLGCQ